MLGKLEPVSNAGYQTGHHDTCLRATREAVLDEIMRWAEAPQDRRVFWLNGLAGTGKSTIAQTFSEMAIKSGILGASFFCSRDYLDRKELKNVFPTIAYQLACRYPAFRRRIIRVIEQDPTVSQKSLISQLEHLIVDPLSSTNISCVIVIDALDECIDDQPASAILSVLGHHIKDLSLVKFLITGRPEPWIRNGFHLPLLEPLTQIFLLHEVKLSDVDRDIRLYLQEKLTAVAKKRRDFDVSDSWPCDEDLMTLTKKSSGLFIFASTLAKFIESEHHEPNERLQLILTPRDSTVHEGGASIDSLYIQILMHAFAGVQDATVFVSLRRVLGVVTLAFIPLSRKQIAKILGITPSLVVTTLRHLHSVLLIPTEDSKDIRVFHKSFPDFLQDRDRCSNLNFFIDSSVHHADIALDCLELLKRLKSNPCNLPDFVMNRDVADLPELLEDRVGGATRYACGYWAMHIRSSPAMDDYTSRLVSSATEFFKNVIPWIEVMSLENKLESVIHSVSHLLDWLGTVDAPVSNLRSLVEDCLRFTIYFFNPIQQSASHIYHSALPLSPTSSAFHSRTLNEKTVIAGFYGQPDGWGIAVRTITPSSKHFTRLTTFGHKIAAIRDGGTVGIYDSVMGVLKQSLDLVDPVMAIGGTPDGSLLFCAHKTRSITVWDVQTGELIHTLILEQNAEELAVSSKGHYLACGLSDGSCKVWEIADEVGGGAIWARSPIARFCWLLPEEHLVVSIRGLVDIWDVVAGTLLHSFTIRHPVDLLVHSQKYDQLAIVSNSTLESEVTVINLRTGTPTTSHSSHQRFSCFAFSQTAEELVCGMETGGLQLFNIPMARFKHFEYPHTATSISSLQNGTIVANFKDTGIQLLNLEGGHPPSQHPAISALTVHAFDQDRIIAVFSANRDKILLLEPDTMFLLLEIPIKNTSRTPTILCASHENLMAVYYFEEGGRGFLQSWRFHEEAPRWTAEVDGVPDIGGISPTAARLVTFHTMDGVSRVYVWNAQNGRLDERREHISPPLRIEFASDAAFSLKYDGFRASCIFGSQELAVYEESLDYRSERSQEKQYFDVDDTHEWVVRDSKRICWIPSGYIGSIEPSYCWAGSLLIMVGQDGVSRKLTFLELYEMEDDERSSICTVSS